MSTTNTTLFEKETCVTTTLGQNALSSPSSSAPISREQFFDYVKRQEEIERARSEATRALIKRQEEIERNRSDATLENIRQLLFGSSELLFTQSASPATFQSPNGAEINIEEVHSTTTPTTPNANSNKPKIANTLKSNAATQNSTNVKLNPTLSSSRGNFSNVASSSSNNVFIRRCELPSGGKQTQRSRHCGGVEVLQLNCSECPFTASSELQLKNHLQREHRIHQHRCHHRQCRNSFVDSRLLFQHVQRDHSGRQICQSCSKEYKTISRMAKHYAIFHQKGFYQCSRCRSIKETLKEAIDQWKTCMIRGLAAPLQQPNFVRQKKPAMKLRGHETLNS